MKDFSSLIADLSAQVTHTDFVECVPTFCTIREVQKKIEENAGCIDCSLPNTETFAHIWLTKSPEEWTRLTNLPQVQEPQQPNRPIIPNSATAARIAQLNQEYEVAKAVYDKTKAIKTLLIKQIIQAFDPKYLAPLRHRTTRQMTHNSIHAIITWLYKNYGLVPSKIVREKKMELFNTTLDLDAPLLMFFEEIEEFRILSQAAKITETDAQIMDMALTILQDSGAFTQALIEWEQKEETEKTWVNLTTFFDDAHRALRKASGVPIGQSQFQANAIIQEVTSYINKNMEDKLSALTSSVNMALQMAEQTPTKRVRCDSSTTELRNLFMEQMNNMQDEYKKEIANLKQELSKKSNDGNDKKGGSDKDRGKGKGNKRKNLTSRKTERDG